MTDIGPQVLADFARATAATAAAIEMFAARLAIVWSTIVDALRRQAVDLADFVTQHQPTRTRSGRWRLRLPTGGTRVYRSRALAMAALRRWLVAA